MSAAYLLLLPQPGLARSSFLSAPGRVHLAVPPATFTQTDLNILLGIPVLDALQESPDCFITMCSFLQSFNIHIEAKITIN